MVWTSPATCRAARARAFRSRPTRARLAPSLAQARAIASPMPRLPPVTTTTLPSSFDMNGSAWAVGSHQSQELGARLIAITKNTQHRRSHRNGILFFDAPHNHAEVARFDHHTHALGLDFFHDGFGNLSGQTFLNLKAARKGVDEPGNFTETDDSVGGYVSHVATPEKRQQMMLAHAEYFDVLYDHHFVVGDVEQGSIQDLIHILLIATGQIPQGLGHALWSFQQSLASWVLAQLAQNFAHRVFNRIDARFRSKIGGTDNRVRIGILHLTLLCWSGS